MVRCDVCGELRSKKNMSRHSRSCRGDQVTASCQPVDASMAAGVSFGEKTVTRNAELVPQVAASVPQEVSAPPYCPATISAVLSSVIGEAVPALLDQHHMYSLEQLTGYLEKYYPEILVSVREPVVMAATLAARQAALLHGIVEKNVNSRDSRKREFAAEAASTLSFWALGLRPEHRSGSVYVGSPPQDGVADLSETTTDGHLIMASLPVPVAEDDEFNRMVEEIEEEGHRANFPALSPISSAPGCSRAASATTSCETAPLQVQRPKELPPVPVSTVAAADVTKTPASMTTVMSSAIVSAACKGSNESLMSDKSVEVPFVIHAPSDSGLDADLCSPVSAKAVEVQKCAGTSVPSGDGRPRPVVPKGGLAVEPERRRGMTGSHRRPRASSPRSRSPVWNRGRSASRTNYRRMDNRVTLSVEEYHDLIRCRRQFRN